MKFLTNVKFLFLVLAAGLWLTSCTDEPGTGTGGSGGGTGGGAETATTVDLLSGTGLVTSVSTIPVGSTFKVNLSAVMGTDSLLAFKVAEDGVNISADRITKDGASVAANPLAVLGSEKKSFSYILDIQSHSEVSTKTYTFTVIDADNDEASVSVEITTEGTPPSLIINGSETINVNPGSANIVNITGTLGSGAISTLGVYMNNELMDLAGLEIDDQAFPSNPLDLIGTGYDEGFDMTKIRVMAPSTSGTYVVKFVATDIYGLTSTDEITFIVGTPLSSIEGVLLNAAGPAGTGGLDLDTGMSTGTGATSGAEAEIRDLGIDQTQPDASNWIRKISGMNGAVVKYLRANEGGLTEGFSWSSIDSKETLAGLVDNGVGFDNGESNEVEVGDIFIVQANGKVYGLLTTAVNVKATDNSDNYVFTIVQ